MAQLVVRPRTLGYHHPQMTGSARDALVCQRFVRELMRSRDGITQAVLAERLSTSQGFVSNVLAGERPIPWDDLPRWADALDMTHEQRALFKRYAIRSYGSTLANEFLDELDNAQARLNALERELGSTITALDAVKKYAERLELENISLRTGRDSASRRVSG